MPELPEVEATRRHLAPELTGCLVLGAGVHRDRMVRHHERPEDFCDRLAGRRVDRIDRLGKFLLTRIAGDLTWVTHLGMSGRLQLTEPGAPRPAHTNVTVDFEGGRQLRFVDPRTFGFMAVYTPEEAARSSLARLGPDALDDLPRSPQLRARLRGRTAPIKALLLDQTVVAGLGNIYADEALHRSRIAPTRPGGSLSPDEVTALRSAIRPVLRAGLAAGGTSLDDLAYLLPDGRAGDHLGRLAVYGRTDEPCRRCGSVIEARVLRGRTTHWCPGCQA